MATVANITINDGTANQTFSPVRREGDRLTFMNRVGTIASSWKSVVLGYSMRSARRRTDKVSIDFTFPLTRVVDGVPMVADKALFRSQVVLPETMTDSEKTEFTTIVNALTSHAVVKAYIQGDPMVG